MSAFGKFAIRLFCKILGILPRAWVRALGRPLGVLWFDILRVRRQIVLDNLKLAFPEWTEAERLEVGRHSVYSLNENFFEFFLVPSMTEKWMKDNVVLEGAEHLKKALAQGKGVYALSMHLGNGDIAASSLAFHKFKIHLISKSFKNKTLNSIWYYIRKFQGVRFIEAHGSKTPFEILKAIRDQEVVVFVNDQFMGPPFGVEVEFFGKKTGAAFGLAVFYLKTRSPVLPIYSFEGDDGKFHVKIEPPLDLEPLVSEDKTQTYSRITQHVTRVIERIVREHPRDWMWVHRRWKEFG